MASMSFVLLVIGFSYCSAAIPAKHPVYEIPIQKNLNNGDVLPSLVDPIIVTVDSKLENGAYSMNIDFKYDIPEITVTSLTVYLATEDQEIAEIIFTAGKLSTKRWSKPWNLASSDEKTMKEVLPTNANVVIPTEWIPKTVITGISASIEATVGDTPIVLNYYGLKNYLISLPDRYVVKNYMKVDLDVFWNHKVMIEVGKTLNNGNPISKTAEIFITTIIRGVFISYDIKLPDGFKNITATTVYFANTDGEITEIQFRQGITSGKKFKKPWELVENLAPYEGDGINPVKFRMSIRDWLPLNVTRISASINATDVNNESHMLCYYGLKNYLISLPHFYVLKNYKTVPPLS